MQTNHENETWVRNAAYALVNKYGFVEAQNMCKRLRDQSSLGTASYAMDNAICKQLYKFATVGQLHRQVED